MRANTLIASTAAVVATAGGLATRPAGQSVWYHQLRKPAYQPPRLVFPVVWPALYADFAAVSAATLDRLRDGGDAAALAFAFVLSTHIWLLNRRVRIDVP